MTQQDSQGPSVFVCTSEYGMIFHTDCAVTKYRYDSSDAGRNVPFRYDPWCAMHRSSVTPLTPEQSFDCSNSRASYILTGMERNIAEIRADVSSLSASQVTLQDRIAALEYCRDPWWWVGLKSTDLWVVQPSCNYRVGWGGARTYCVWNTGVCVWFAPDYCT